MSCTNATAIRYQSSWQPEKPLEGREPGLVRSAIPQLEPQKVNHGDGELSRPAGGAAIERHYSPEQLAELWGFSADTIRRLFEREPGVLVMERNVAGRRRYRTLRIPESVAERVHRRLTRV